jgi:propionyl-CoA carboxylase beta chain
MSSKHLAGDINFAWPTAEVAVMGAKAAMDVLYKDPKEREQALQEYNDKFLNPLIAAQLGYVDEIIEPSMTRRRIIEELQVLRNKQRGLVLKRHGNIPL